MGRDVQKSLGRADLGAPAPSWRRPRRPPARVTPADPACEQPCVPHEGASRAPRRPLQRTAHRGLPPSQARAHPSHGGPAPRPARRRRPSSRRRGRPTPGRGRRGPRPRPRDRARGRPAPRRRRPPGGGSPTIWPPPSRLGVGSAPDGHAPVGRCCRTGSGPEGSIPKTPHRCLRVYVTVPSSPCVLRRAGKLPRGASPRAPARAGRGRWRRGQDSNLRYGFAVYALSKRAPSTARPPLRA